MKPYSSRSLYSFKYDRDIIKEIQMKRVYTRNGSKVEEIFYAERTSDVNKLIVPDYILENYKDNSPFGFIAEVKQGEYFMGKVRVYLTDVEQVYCGAGIVSVKNLNE